MKLNCLICFCLRGWNLIVLSVFVPGGETELFNLFLFQGVKLNCFICFCLRGETELFNLFLFKGVKLNCLICFCLREWNWIVLSVFVPGGEAEQFWEGWKWRNKGDNWCLYQIKERRKVINYYTHSLIQGILKEGWIISNYASWRSKRCFIGRGAE